MSVVASGSPAYTREEVLENFSILLDGLDCIHELALLGIRWHQFLERRKAFRELRALCIALWRLALLRSFPDDGESIFEQFLDDLLHDAETEREILAAKQFDETIRHYVLMLNERGDADFTSVSEHIVTMFLKKTKNPAPCRLKLALLIRNTYTIIFQNLI